jgi:hypothetical protein
MQLFVVNITSGSNQSTSEYKAISLLVMKFGEKICLQAVNQRVCDPLTVFRIRLTF